MLENLRSRRPSRRPHPPFEPNRTQPADPQPTTQGGWAGVVERGEAEVGGVAKNFEFVSFLASDLVNDFRAATCCEPVASVAVATHERIEEEDRLRLRPTVRKKPNRPIRNFEFFLVFQMKVRVHQLLRSRRMTHRSEAGDFINL